MLCRRDRIIGILISPVALAVIPGAPSIAGESATHPPAVGRHSKVCPKRSVAPARQPQPVKATYPLSACTRWGGMSQSNNAYATNNLLDSTTGSWHAVSHMKTGLSAFGVTRGPCPSRSRHQLHLRSRRR